MTSTRRRSAVPVLLAAVLCAAGALACFGGAAYAGEVKLPGARPAIDAAEYTSLQAAIDAVGPGGGLVRLPPGRFEITRPLRVTRGDVAIAGAGPATHIVNLAEDGGPAILIAPPDGTENPKKNPIWRVQLSDFRLTGNPGSGPGIDARHVNELFLKDLTVSGHGGHGVRTYYCYEDPRVSDCLVTYNLGDGLRVEGNHDTIVSSNHFEENATAVRCVDGYNATVVGNNIDDHTADGIVLENFYGSVLSGNMVEQSKGTGIRLERGCYGVAVSANVVIGNGGGIDVRACHSVAVGGNALASNPSFGLRVSDDSGNVTAAGNNFSGAFVTPDGIPREADGGPREPDASRPGPSD